MQRKYIMCMVSLLIVCKGSAQMWYVSGSGNDDAVELLSIKYVTQVHKTNLLKNEKQTARTCNAMKII